MKFRRCGVVMTVLASDPTWSEARNVEEPDGDPAHEHDPQKDQRKRDRGLALWVVR